MADDRILGHVTIAPEDAHEPEFMVLVHPDHHNRSIGTELTKHAIAHAGAGAHDALVLRVEKTNRRAINIYESLCFEYTDRSSPELEIRLQLGSTIVDRIQLPPVARLSG